MAIEDQMRTRLEEALAPDRLDIVNESHRHVGHAGDDGSGESHWRVTIRAPSLDGLSRIEKHRRIHAALGPEILDRIHALALDVS